MPGFASTPERRNWNIKLNKYFISSNGHRTYSQSCLQSHCAPASFKMKRQIMQGIISTVWPTAEPVKTIATITLLQRNSTWNLVPLLKFGGLRFLRKIIGVSLFKLKECGRKPLGFGKLINSCEYCKYWGILWGWILRTFSAWFLFMILLSRQPVHIFIYRFTAA